MTDAFSAQQQIRQARKSFAAMAATYGMGVFNDSLFRQSAMLLAVAGDRAHLQGWITAAFALPFLLLASPAGWLADRFSKRRVVISAKALELLAMMCGAIAICAGNWPLLMVMVFTMGAQSCLFSPALNGSIPELYPASYVTRANARLKIVVTAMILAGIAASGQALSCRGAGWGGIGVGRLVVAGTVVVISLLGLLGSLGVPYRPPAAPHARPALTGPGDTFRQLAAISRDRLLSIVVAADVYVWFVGALLMPLINVLAMRQFGRGEDVAGYMVAGQVVGVAMGGLLGSRLAVGVRWHRVLPAGALGMGALLAAMGAVPMLPGGWRVGASFVILGLVGVMGGMFLIPCEAFVQVRPAKDRKGTVIAAVNFAVFGGILIGGLAANLLTEVMRLSPSAAMAGAGALSLATGVWLWRALAEEAVE